MKIKFIHPVTTAAGKNHKSLSFVVRQLFEVSFIKVESRIWFNIVIVGFGVGIFNG